MPEAIAVEGPEAEKVWADFFEKLLPLGPKLAQISRSGQVAVAMIETIPPSDPPIQATGLDSGVRQKLVREFASSGDQVSAAFLRGDRQGRVLVFYQAGSFLLNLDLDKDPSKRESYTIEPNSLDTYSSRREGMVSGWEKGVERDRALSGILKDLDRYKKHGFQADMKIEGMMQALTINEVDKIERLIGEEAKDFATLLSQWVMESNPFDITGLSLDGRKLASKDLGEKIHAEFVRRGLDRWITNGPSVRAVEHEPPKALASLMSARLFQLMEGKLQCPSGRWLTIEDFDKAAAEMILPPLVTPNNIEVAMMSLARFAAYVETHRTMDVIALLKNRGPRRPIYDTSSFHALLFLLGFGVHWREMGFARLELGHKLAAALMFTDAPESVEAPWLAWSLILPDGLFGEIEIRRVWCLGDTPAVLLIKIDDHVGTMCLHVFDETRHWRIDPGPYNPDVGEKMPTLRERFEARGPEYEEKFLRCLPMLQNLVRGVCLALSNPQDWRKGDYYGKPSGSEVKKASKHKELPVGERYVLGQPVQIDLREEVMDHVRTGKIGGKSPTKLFLVRGHHRRQAHGKGRLERKTIWIEPFWKGPEDARVLLRPHQT